jgi:hypothetical protein
MASGNINFKNGELTKNFEGEDFDGEESRKLYKI